jgi:hypothetical protein
VPLACLVVLCMWAEYYHIALQLIASIPCVYGCIAFAAVPITALLLVTMRERLSFLDAEPYWKWKAGILPVLRVNNKLAAKHTSSSSAAAVTSSNGHKHAD